MESQHLRYEVATTKFDKIPGNPIAYWVSNNFVNAFKNGKLLGNVVPVKKGMDTSNNEYFLRMWFEVQFISIDLNEGKKKWIPYNKGGNFRKWYGNNEYILRWENDGYELKKSRANLRSEHLYFKESITWSALTSANTSFRYSLYKGAFDSAGSSMFPPLNKINNLLGLLNTIIVQFYLTAINPTLNYGAGSIANIPILECDVNINKLVENNICMSKDDWDSFETSWDFKKHPLI